MRRLKNKLGFSLIELLVSLLLLTLILMTSAAAQYSAVRQSGTQIHKQELFRPLLEQREILEDSHCQEHQGKINCLYQKTPQTSAQHNTLLLSIFDENQ